MDQKTISNVLKDAFKDIAVSPNQVVVDMLYDSVEVSLHDTHEKFTAYKIEGEAVIWICAACGQTNIFTSDEHYTSKGGIFYYQSHEPDCG